METCDIKKYLDLMAEYDKQKLQSVDVDRAILKRVTQNAQQSKLEAQQN